MAAQRRIFLFHLSPSSEELQRLKSSLPKEAMGYFFQVSRGKSTYQMWKTLASSVPDLVLLDIVAPTGEVDFAVLSEVKTRVPDAVAIVYSKLRTAQAITKCLSYGADDFLLKSCPTEEIGRRLVHAYLCKKSSPASGSYPHAVGQTMKRVTSQLQRLTNSAVSAVHVAGESGTGKEVVAQIIQWLVKPRPVIKINCGGISPTLMESELFGHRRGAFTGATGDKVGYIEQARGGWLFLDEVACLTSNMQAALLRVLESGELIRVGESTPRKVDVNILSASNVPIPELVEKKLFRLDLWQRLQEVEIELPPLRMRRVEIPKLVHYFLLNMRGGPYRISEEALEVLSQSVWREGNIRELRNCLRAMSVHHINGLLTPLSIPPRIWKKSLSANDNEKLDDHQLAIEVRNAFRGNFTASYEVLSHMLLLECVKENYRRRGRSGVRSFASTFNISSSTASRRLRMLIDQGLVSHQELSAYVAIEVP